MMPFYCLQSSHVFDEHFISLVLCMSYVLFLWLLSKFKLMFPFQHHREVPMMWFSSYLSCLEYIELPGSVNWCFPLNLGHCFFKYFYFPVLFIFEFILDIHYTTWYHPIDHWSCANFFSPVLIFLSPSDWIIFIALSPASFNLPFSPLSDFYHLRHCTFQFYNF